MYSIYSVGTVVKILEGEYKGCEGVVKKSIGFGNYMMVNPIVDEEVKNIPLILHVNEVMKTDLKGVK